MPDINLQTLNGIPGINQADMTQEPFMNNCGAYAIIAAVGAHGVFPIAAQLNYANAGPQQVNNNAQVNLVDNYPQLAAAAYTITGILNNAFGIPVNPELIAVGNAYNSPAAMAQVAINLGRQAPFINAQAGGFNELNERYPGEQARCVGVLGANNVNVNAGNYVVPNKGQTHVVCVCTVPQGGLHWVAQGSDGNFYDPADGTLNNAWNPLQIMDPMGPNYIFSGLWMVIN